jgi:hypothetical protein
MASTEDQAERQARIEEDIRRLFARYRQGRTEADVRRSGERGKPRPDAPGRFQRNEPSAPGSDRSGRGSISP